MVDQEKLGSPEWLVDQVFLELPELMVCMVLECPCLDQLALRLEHLECNLEFLVLVHLVLPSLDRLGIVALAHLELGFLLGQLR